ncbi:unnamed protein product, partial [marine sediment metagenome]
LVVFLIYTTVWLPYQANSLALKYYAYILNGKYEEAQSFLKQASEINSPYTFFEVRKRSSWEFLRVLEWIDEEISASVEAMTDKEKEDIKAITNINLVLVENLALLFVFSSSSFEKESSSGL